MRLEVDVARCQGYANCIVEAPDLFDFDEDTGKAVVLVAQVAETHEDQARRAIADCPVAAIRALD